MKRYQAKIMPLITAALIHFGFSLLRYWQDLHFLWIFVGVFLLTVLFSLQYRYVHQSGSPVLMGGVVMLLYLIIGTVEFFLSDHLASLRLRGELREEAFLWLSCLTVGVITFVLTGVESLIKRLKRPAFLKYGVAVGIVAFVTLSLSALLLGAIRGSDHTQDGELVGWGCVITALAVLLCAVYDGVKRTSFSKKGILRASFFIALGLELAVMTVFVYMPRPDGIFASDWYAFGYEYLFWALGVLAMAGGLAFVNLADLLIGRIRQKIAAKKKAV